MLMARAHGASTCAHVRQVLPFQAKTHKPLPCRAAMPTHNGMQDIIPCRHADLPSITHVTSGHIRHMHYKSLQRRTEQDGQGDSCKHLDAGQG